MEEPKLLVAFEDQSSSYVHGFEAGRIWSDLGSTDEKELDFTIHTDNIETVRRMAVYKGWEVSFFPTEIEEWTFTTLVRGDKTTKITNPYGLHIV